LSLNVDRPAANTALAAKGCFPIWSVEAGQLLKEAYDRFGIQQMLEASKQNQLFLERRFQWAKTQLIVGLAVLTYILDKFKIFDLMTGHFKG
jgi:hypothetical protein